VSQIATPATLATHVPQPSATRGLAEFACRTSFEDLPDRVVHVARRALLDLLGCSLSGSRVEDVRTLIRGIKSFDAGSAATIWGLSERASCPMAAMANATAAHSQELDDCGGPAHVGTVVIPTALAVAETVPVDGRQLLRAIVLGYELMYRIADGIGGYRPIVTPGWQPIAVMGAFGSAAAAGVLLGLSPDQLTSALGLAGSFAGGSFAFLSDGSMSKRWHPGRAAANGVEAVFLAAQGFTGPSQILEAAWGSFYGTLFPSATPNFPAITAGLGSTYRMMDTVVKAYPCCLGIHPYLEALGRVLDEGVRATDIGAIEVGGDPINKRMLGKAEVETVLDAQMSVAYTLAAYAYAGRATLDLYTPRWLADPAVRRLAQNVSMMVLDGAATPYVAVRLANGDSRVEPTREYWGTLANPVTDEQLQHKVLALATPVLGPERAHALVRQALDFERTADVGAFSRSLAG
jgi:2-methylcitrate dehydratase PrpD